MGPSACKRGLWGIVTLFSFVFCLISLAGIHLVLFYACPLFMTHVRFWLKEANFRVHVISLPLQQLKVLLELKLINLWLRLLSHLKNRHWCRDGGATLRLGGASFNMGGGGTRHLCLLTLYNSKKIGGDVPPPPPSPPCSAVPVMLQK